MESKQSIGGKARAESLTPERRAQIASSAAKARWGSGKQSPKRMVYVIGAADSPVKIGMAGSPACRRSELQIGSPLVLSLFAAIDPSPHDAKDVESAVHYELAGYWVRGEWFDVTPERAEEVIRGQVANLRMPPRPEPGVPRGTGRRRPFQIRMDDARLARLNRVAAQLGVSKTSIIEAAIDVRLDMLEGYVKLDTAPPKTVPLALARKVKGATLKPGGVTYTDGTSDAAVITGRLKAEALVRTQPKVTHVKPTDELTKNLGQTRSVRGYAIDGSPIYR